MSRGGAEREKETESEAGCRLWASCQHRAWCGAQTHKLWDHDLSRSRMLHWLSYPDAYIFFLIGEGSSEEILHPCNEILLSSISEFRLSLGFLVPNSWILLLFLPRSLNTSFGRSVDNIWLLPRGKFIIPKLILVCKYLRSLEGTSIHDRTLYILTIMLFYKYVSYLIHRWGFLCKDVNVQPLYSRRLPRGSTMCPAQ